MKALNDIIFELDENMVYVNLFTNDEKKLFFPKEQIIGKGIYELFPQDFAEKFIRIYEHAAASGKKETMEYPLIVPKSSLST